MGSSEGGRSPAAVSMADLIRRWRVPEFAGLGVAFVIVSLFKACFSEHEQFIPPNNMEGINGYPIRLGPEWCTAKDLSSCETQPDTECCTEMATGESPFETVDSLLLWLVYFAVPVTFIAVRQVLTKLGLHRGATNLADVSLGLLFCLALSATVTDGIKLMVGRPRPNYAALRALVEYGGTGAASFKGMSIRSFPSGHSSMSMAGTLYITLVCWGDVSRFTSDSKGPRRTFLAHLSILPVLIALGVGVSRIRDYWHFQDDVVAGWIIGAASAGMAVRWVTFPEAFWRGGGGGGGSVGGNDRFGIVGHGSIQSLRDNGALQMMIGSTSGSGDADDMSDAGDLGRGAPLSGDTLA